MDAKQRRPPAPKGMPTRARQLWTDIVATLPADYFTASDLPLLRQYCIASHLAEEAEEAISKDGAVMENRPHPMLKVLDAQTASMARLATKLRLCPSSRIRADSAALRKAHEGPRPWACSMSQMDP